MAGLMVHRQSLSYLLEEALLLSLLFSSSRMYKRTIPCSFPHAPNENILAAYGDSGYWSHSEF